jgi:hypothetical protein
MAGENAQISDELARYLARVGERARRVADWERDAPFVAMALARFPEDMEGCALGRESNRSRMRLRYQGYTMLSNARKEVEAIRAAADSALAAMGGAKRRKNKVAKVHRVPVPEGAPRGGCWLSKGTMCGKAAAGLDQLTSNSEEVTCGLCKRSMAGSWGRAE